jgi:hypothetical protein
MFLQHSMCDVIRDVCLLGQITESSIKNRAILFFVTHAHIDFWLIRIFIMIFLFHNLILSSHLYTRIPNSPFRISD